MRWAWVAVLALVWVGATGCAGMTAQEREEFIDRSAEIAGARAREVTKSTFEQLSTALVEQLKAVNLSPELVTRIEDVLAKKTAELSEKAAEMAREKVKKELDERLPEPAPAGSGGGLGAGLLALITAGLQLASGRRD